MNNPVNALFSSPEFTDFLFNKLSVAIFLADKDLRIQKINEPFHERFHATDKSACGKPYGEVLGCEFSVMQIKPCGQTSECASCKIRETLLKSFESPNELQTASVARNFFMDGASVPKRLRITGRQAVFNGTPMVAVAIHDLTDEQDQKEKIQEMANRDFLTGLAHRRYFFDVGESLFQNAKRGNISISVAMFDIDHFKNVNNTYGNAAGDLVLKEISDILVANLRKADIISRFGGEEFCILMHCKDPGDAYTVIDKLRLFVELHTFAFNGKKIDVTISAGLTSVLGENLDSMIKKADEMLHKAKANGRNRTEEFT